MLLSRAKPNGVGTFVLVCSHFLCIKDTVTHSSLKNQRRNLIVTKKGQIIPIWQGRPLADRLLTHRIRQQHSLRIGMGFGQRTNKDAVPANCTIKYRFVQMDDIKVAIEEFPSRSPSILSSILCTTSSEQSDDRRRSEERIFLQLESCLADHHYQALSRIVALVGIIACTVPFWAAIFVGAGCWLGDLLWTSEFAMVVFTIIASIGAFYIFVLLYSADRERKPTYYLPFLIINGAISAFSLVSLFISIMMYFALPKFWEHQFSVIQYEEQWRKDEEVRIYTQLLIVVFLLVGTKQSMLIVSVVLISQIIMRAVATDESHRVEPISKVEQENEAEHVPTVRELYAKHLQDPMNTAMKSTIGAFGDAKTKMLNTYQAADKINRTGGLTALGTTAKEAVNRQIELAKQDRKEYFSWLGRQAASGVSKAFGVGKGAAHIGAGFAGFAEEYLRNWAKEPAGAKKDTKNEHENHVENKSPEVGENTKGETKKAENEAIAPTGSTQQREMERKQEME
ncbi:hypothetical protein Ddc_11745 [Ditylenchus destructor]|nr:hypothetical protein Ddc_11745 [Ditylenchus destructor]